MENDTYPIPLPQGAIIERQSTGHPSEYASDNYAIVALAHVTVGDILSFYRCNLPRQNLSIISEEKGNATLIRFAGEDIDDGSITLSDETESGGTRIEIFVVEKEK